MLFSFEGQPDAKHRENCSLHIYIISGPERLGNVFRVKTSQSRVAWVIPAVWGDHAVTRD